jgi:L-fucose mutarotase
MLKGIPAIISPELMKTLMEAGHGDEILFADGNFPLSAASGGGKIVRCDGHGIPEILSAVLKFFPLDTYLESPAILMAKPADTESVPIWEKYSEILNAAESRKIHFTHLERFAFYDRAKNTYATVYTGERALCANIILKKGVVDSY